MASKIEAADIKVGMYVSELDRPWIDTDFLFQGFLIYDDEQVEKLRALCKFIYVDEEKSTPGIFAATPVVAAPKKTLKTPRVIIHDEKTAKTKQKSSGGFFSTLKKIFGDLRSSDKTIFQLMQQMSMTAPKS